MGIDNPQISLKYRIDKDFAANFDELVNIDVSNRKSDVWFTDQDKLMIKMRPWTTQVWNTIAWGTWTGNQYFYTDFAKTRRHYRAYNSKLWYNNSGTWTDIWTFSSNSLNFNTVKLPVMLNGTTPTTYTTWSVSTGAERVKIAAADPAFGSVWTNVWKYLIVLSDTAYKWAFWYIIENDWTEYVLNWAWIITTIQSGATYKIYDTLWEYLQVMDWVSNDRYFQWITEHTPYAWLVKDSLRLVKALTSSQYPVKQVWFNLSYFSFVKTTLFYSAWAINNPFLHYINGALTFPFSWDIVDIFTFKNRLIIWGTNFLVALNRDLTYDILSHSFWIKIWSMIDVWDDLYFLATSWQVKSLSEVVSWNTTVLVINDIGKPVSNYTKNFLSNIAAWFDGRKMYMYGQVDGSTIGTMIVFDVLYKFWSVYTWLRPASILNEDGTTYLTSNNSDKVYKFDPTVTTDMWTNIEQAVVTKEIDLWDVFSIKRFVNTYFWFDNYAQELYFNVYAAVPNKNSLIYNKEIWIVETDVAADWAPPLWEWELWENILWWNWFTSAISYPYILKEVFPVDKANIWKCELVWKDGSPFYLNEMDITLEWAWIPRKYFAPQYTY